MNLIISLFIHISLYIRGKSSASSRGTGVAPFYSSRLTQFCTPDFNQKSTLPRPCLLTISGQTLDSYGKGVSYFKVFQKTGPRCQFSQKPWISYKIEPPHTMHFNQIWPDLGFLWIGGNIFQGFTKTNCYTIAL